MQAEVVARVSSDPRQQRTAIDVQANQYVGLIICPRFADDGGVQAVKDAAVLNTVKAQADIAGLYFDAHRPPDRQRLVRNFQLLDAVRQLQGQ